MTYNAFNHPQISRRTALKAAGIGFGHLALAGMLGQQTARAATVAAALRFALTTTARSSPVSGRRRDGGRTRLRIPRRKALLRGARHRRDVHADTRNRRWFATTATAPGLTRVAFVERLSGRV